MNPVDPSRIYSMLSVILLKILPFGIYCFWKHCLSKRKGAHANNIEKSHLPPVTIHTTHGPQLVMVKTTNELDTNGDSSSAPVNQESEVKDAHTDNIVRRLYQQIDGNT